MKGCDGMEEQQIQEFVQRATRSEALRAELGRDPLGVVTREGFSSRVAEIILCLAPHLAFERPLNATGKWWHV